jgi:tetratricopeptide (TPR) repeat protein
VLSALGPWLGAPQPAPAALQLAGLAQQRLGRLDEARQLQQRLVQQTPADVAAWVNLAATEAALGLHAQALQHLERALQLDAAQPAIHFNRGHVLMQMGDAAAALESFRRAGDLAPERPDPVCNQAAALTSWAGTTRPWP